jgi:hypothetical protein
MFFPSDSTFYSCRVNVKLDDNNGPYNVGLVIKKERRKRKKKDSGFCGERTRSQKVKKSKKRKSFWD